MSWTELDPGFGDPDTIGRLAHDLRVVADTAASARSQLVGVTENATDAVWRGPAATAFHDRIAALPGHLDRLARSYHDAAAGISTYAASVREIKQQAAPARAAATAAAAGVAAAEAGLAALALQPSPFVVPADPTTSTAASAADALAEARAQLNRASAQLRGLGADRQVADTKVSASLTQARHSGMKNHSRWVHIWHAVAKTLAVITIVLIVIAVICIAIALPEVMVAFVVSDGLFSGMLFAAGTALEAGLGAGVLGLSVGTAMTIVGAASLVTEVVLAQAGQGSWKTVAIDAGLTLGPGPVLKGVKYTREVEAGIRPRQLPAVNERISRQRQLRHVKGSALYVKGGYFDNALDAETVLDAYHGRTAVVVRRLPHGEILVRLDSVTGFNHNPRSNYFDQPTHLFMIKGTTSVSVVPYSPKG